MVKKVLGKVVEKEERNELDLFISYLPEKLPENCVTKTKANIFISPKPKKQYVGFKKKIIEWMKNEQNGQEHLFMCNYNAVCPMP